MPADTSLPILKTLMSPFTSKVKQKEDSLKQSLNKNKQKADSLAPKAGHPKSNIKLVLHRSNPSLNGDSLGNPAPNAIAMYKGTCRIVLGVPLWVMDTVKLPVTTDILQPKPLPKVPFMTVHGNVMYNVNYYSRIDTPYNEDNIYQHTIQTYLDVLIKGQYPFRVFLTNNFSNSPLFHNFNDFNMSWTNTGFNQSIKNQLIKQYQDSLPSTKRIDSLQHVLNADLQKLNGLNGWLTNPGLIQKLVEAREAAYFAQRIRPVDSTKTSSGLPLNGIFGLQKTSSSGGNSDTAHLDSLYRVRKMQTDSLQKQIAMLEKLLVAAHVAAGGDEKQNEQDIQNAQTPDQLQKEMKKLGLSDSSLPKGYKTLMSIRSISVGRSMVNYSELSAKNISINGLQVEYNPRNYYAIATGMIDYRFRDFLLQGPSQTGTQYMNVVRYGRGLRDGNSIILTYYQGRRQLFSSTTIDSPYTQTPNSYLMGLTLEGHYKVSKNIMAIGELAKSSVPEYTDTTKEGGKSLAGQMFTMNDRSNEAYSIKLIGVFPQTQTKVDGGFKHLGENFQSFSVFTDGEALTSWNAKVDQLLFKKQLDIIASAYTNDFTNPYISNTFSSNTVFKSLQATWRRKNWPILSLGYFPSNQLTSLGNGQYEENVFYTLVGNATWSYVFHRIMMNSTLVYTQFYNRSADSGFVYFNTKNLLFSQSVYLKSFTLQGNVSASVNQDYDLYTLEGKVQHNISRNLTIGAGVKYNDQTVYDIVQWGWSAELMWRMGKLGQIQFSADKGFIPGMNNQLVPNNTGRLTYFKTF
jgi:hypothetical protein